MKPDEVPDPLMSKGRGALAAYLAKVPRQHIPLLADQVNVAIAAVHDDIVKKARAEWFKELFGDPVERAKEPMRPDSREEILGRMLDYLKPDELVRCSEMVADRIAQGGQP